MTEFTRGSISTLYKLREIMHDLGIDAFYIGSADAHKSEFVAASEDRRAYISGFTGSAGTALVTLNEALLWTDGRYFVQAQQQLNNEWTLMKSGQPGVLECPQWINENLTKGSIVGIDALLLSNKEE